MKLKIYGKDELNNLSKEQVIEICIRLQNIILNITQKKNSKNSSKPPRTEQKANINNKSDKIGAKIGHKGNGYKRTANVDKKVYYKLEKCPNCDALLDDKNNINHKGYQTIDIKIKKEVTEHILEKKYCPNCKKYVTAHKDDNYPHQHYENGIRSLILYLHNAQHISQDRIQEMLFEIIGLKISKGEINEILMDLPKSVDKTYEQIREGIRNSKVVGADETGYRNDGKNNWVWIFRNDFLSYFEFTDTRGAKIVKEVLSERFTGILLSDFYSAYGTLDYKKGKCNAHLLRDIRFWKENSVGEEKKFIEDFESLLYESKAIAETEGNEKIKLKHLKELEKKFTKFKQYNFSKNSPANKLLMRLLKYYDEIFLFVKEKEVPFTNNGSERDIRKIVLHRKISNCVRSNRGKEALKKMSSIILTLRKQTKNVFESIKSLVRGEKLYLLYDTG